MPKESSYYEKYDVPDSISNRNFQTILQFYLLECPVNICNNTCISVRGRKFKDYGFSGRAKFGRLKSEMMRVATPSLKNNYYPCKPSEVETVWKEKIRTVFPPDEYCVFNEVSQATKMESLFAAIRNAFAHGSFNIKTYNKIRIYFLANDKKGMKARIVLHEETLLLWMKLIKTGPVDC